MGKDSTSEDKWRYTLYTVVVFIIVVNPYTYILVDSILKNVGLNIADSGGCPTGVGLAVHTVVFTLLLRGLMELNI